MKGYVLAAGVGAGVQFFLDPELGRRRRAMARDRTLAIGRRIGRRVGRLGRKLMSDLEGQSERIAHARPRDVPPPNDETLRDRVESELFRDPRIPKGRINVNAEHGTIVLRGELSSPKEIDLVEARVRDVAGVYDVTNLLHLPGTHLRAA